MLLLKVYCIANAFIFWVITSLKQIIPECVNVAFLTVTQQTTEIGNADLHPQRLGVPSHTDLDFFSLIMFTHGHVMWVEVTTLEWITGSSNKLCITVMLELCVPVRTRGGRANLGSSVNTCVKLAGFVGGEMGQRKIVSVSLLRSLLSFRS